MDIDETIERLRLLAEGGQTSGAPAKDAIRQVLEQPAIRSLVQLSLLLWSGLENELVARLKSLPKRPPEEMPLVATELSPRLVELLSQHGVFTLGDLAVALPRDLLLINGMGPEYYRECLLVAGKYLGIAGPEMPLEPTRWNMIKRKKLRQA